MKNKALLLNTFLVILALGTVAPASADQSSVRDYWNAFKDYAETSLAFTSAKAKGAYDFVSNHQVTNAVVADAKTGYESVRTGVIAAYNNATQQGSRSWDLICENKETVIITTIAAGSLYVAYKWLTSPKEQPSDK